MLVRLLHLGCGRLEVLRRVQSRLLRRGSKNTDCFEGRPTGRSNAVVQGSECVPEKKPEGFISMGTKVFHRLLVGLVARESATTQRWRHHGQLDVLGLEVPTYPAGVMGCRGCPSRACEVAVAPLGS